MCGIVGIVPFTEKAPERSVILNMMHSLKHRGPDDEALFVSQHVAFGHVRLSIIDLSQDGRQPMVSEDGRLMIIYNGEIFNYIELKKILSSEYRFRTRTDTEVLLNAYRKWGENCLEHLNGMFAFAIHDRDTNMTFLARDRFGIKPLYYYCDDRQFVFSSEITPIFHALSMKPEADEQTIYQYLIYNRTQQTEKSFFRRVRKLQHGHALRIENKKIHGWCWYDLASKVRPGRVDSKEFLECIQSAVEIQLRSDVPVGACLSGGLDSSTIVSTIIKRFGITNISTFSAVYNRGDSGDESSFIDEYKDVVRRMYFVQPSAQSLLSDLDHFIETMQEPVPSTSAYAEYKVFQLAKNHVKVILNGQGPDELLAGYYYMLGFYYKQLLREFRLPELLQEVIGDIQNHHSLEGSTAFIYFTLPHWLREKIEVYRRGYLSQYFYRSMRGVMSDPLKELFGSRTLSEACLNHFKYKFEHHLIWTDRTSMRFSMESRFPYLDHRFVELALSLEPHQVVKNGVTKKILRSAIKGLVPEKIIQRQDKVGYETPEGNWFRTPRFREFIFDILRSRVFRERGYIDARRAEKLFIRHVNGQLNISAEIWKWIHLELWFQRFIDGPIPRSEEKEVYAASFLGRGVGNRRF